MSAFLLREYSSRQTAIIGKSCFVPAPKFTSSRRNERRERSTNLPTITISLVWSSQAEHFKLKTSKEVASLNSTEFNSKLNHLSQREINSSHAVDAVGRQSCNKEPLTKDCCCTIVSRLLCYANSSISGQQRQCSCNLSWITPSIVGKHC